MIIPDIEIIIVLLVLLSLFIMGLKRKKGRVGTINTVWVCLTIDKNMSVALKGIACVFVLMGHYGTWLLNTDVNCGIVTTMVTHTTANIALAWFMFFSGYGLSLKLCDKDKIGKVLIKRLEKLYFPLLYVCLCAVLIYLVLPYSNLGVAISQWYEEIHHINEDNILSNLRNTFGLNDWYVVCIIYFVSLFYLAVFIAKETGYNLSILLGVLLLCYIVVAYFVYGPPQAHYYRYPWAFMFGHLVATHNRNSRMANIVLLIVFFLTWGLLDKFCILSYVIAIFLLICAGMFNIKYEFNGKILLYLGGLSYFFYLSHERVGWPLIMLSGIEYKSMIMWIFMTILCSIAFDKVYFLLKKNINNKCI